MRRRREAFLCFDVDCNPGLEFHGEVVGEDGDLLDELMLKEHNVEIFFEEENIRTLSMDGELLLTILSSVVQQEVQNISEHVKLSVRHKMASG